MQDYDDRVNLIVREPWRLTLLQDKVSVQVSKRNHEITEQGEQFIKDRLRIFNEGDKALRRKYFISALKVSDRLYDASIVELILAESVFQDLMQEKNIKSL